MKRNIICGAFTLASLMLAGHALAEDGVVHFVGEIVDTTCEVTSDTADQIVPLGKVSKNAFSGVGIRIFNQSYISLVKIYNDSAYTAIDAEGKAEMKFIARYVATNATVTAGTANADSQFTVEYKK